MKETLFPFHRIADKDIQAHGRMSGLAKDYVISYLRSQITTLKYLLEDIERENGFENDYTIESLSRVQIALHRLKKFLLN